MGRILRPASASLLPGAEGLKDAGWLVDAVALVIGKAPASSGDRDIGLVADKPAVTIAG